MAKLYLSGPMRGYDNNNFAAFDAAAQVLRAYGHEVLSPAEMDAQATPDMTSNWEFADFIARDLHVILIDRYDIVLLPGWEKSQGARMEVATASQAGRRIYEYAPDAHEYHGLRSIQVDVELGVKGAAPIETRRVLANSDIVRPIISESSPTVEATPTIRRKDADPRRASEQERGHKDLGLRFDLLPPYPLALVAEVYTRGAKKYDAHNWRRGIPFSAAYAAAQRHLLLFWSGETIDSENGQHHLASVVFHMFLVMEQEARISSGHMNASLDDRWMGPGYQELLRRIYDAKLGATVVDRPPQQSDGRHAT